MSNSIAHSLQNRPAEEKVFILLHELQSHAVRYGRAVADRLKADEACRDAILEELDSFGTDMSSHTRDKVQASLWRAQEELKRQDGYLSTVIEDLHAVAILFSATS